MLLPCLRHPRQHHTHIPLLRLPAMNGREVNHHGGAAVEEEAKKRLHP